MPKTELRVKMEVWRLIRRIAEDDLGLNEHLYCPDSFAITAMLESGEPPDNFPKANLASAPWWRLLKELYRRGARHGNDHVEVIMDCRDDCVALASWHGHCDWEVNYQSRFPGQVWLPHSAAADRELAGEARRFVVGDGTFRGMKELAKQ